MGTAPDGTPTMYRRDFTKTGAKVVLGALFGPTILEILTSGCVEKGDGDKPSKLTEPGSYMIRKANEIYPVSDIPDAEAEIKNFEKWADDMSTGKPLYAISAMLYSAKHKISPEGTVTPTPTATPAESVEYPFDTNAVTMDMIMQYLDGKIDESKFSALFDSESVADLAMMKKKGLTVDKYAVTEGRETGSDDVKYLINTYQTKPDASNQVLTGYMHLKLEKKGTKWVPTKVVESEVYAPNGELGFYYVGRKTGRTKDIIFHAWVEKGKDKIPLIPDAIENPGLTVDQYIRKFYRDAAPGGNIVQHYKGGRVIRIGGPMGTREFQIPSGDYKISFSMDEDTPKIFNEVSTNILGENGVISAAMAVSETYADGKPAGHAWLMKRMDKRGITDLELEDGFLAQSTEPADGNIDGV